LATGTPKPYSCLATTFSFLDGTLALGLVVETLVADFSEAAADFTEADFSEAAADLTEADFTEAFSETA
jgi:uncharacterized protein YjbI with pentapeptide repeats